MEIQVKIGALRAAINNHRTQCADLDLLIAEVRRVGEPLAFV
ncbi:MAG: hypothetical protein R3E79_50695 [Caldilineaceae bacterium]